MAKLGGAVITDLSKPFTYRADVASALSEEISSSDERVVVVHGRGSFAKAAPAQPASLPGQVESPAGGTAQARASVYELNRLVCKTMTEAKLSPYPFSPFDALARAGPSSAGQWLRGLLKEGFTPVTFCDFVLSPHGMRFMDADAMTYEIAKTLKPDRCVFALDVDGVYEDNSRVILPELSPSKIRKMKAPAEDQAARAIRAKLEIAGRIASTGPSVSFVSGYRRNEFSKALRGLDFYGTAIR